MSNPEQQSVFASPGLQGCGLVSMLRAHTALGQLTAVCFLVHEGQSQPQTVGHPLVIDVPHQGSSLWTNEFLTIPFR